MFFLHSGMQTSGTAWHFHLTNDLLMAAGGRDIHRLVELHPRALRYVVGGTSHHDIFRPNPYKVAVLHWLARRGGPFVVKTHAGPAGGLGPLLARGAVKAVYIYRDPRDVALAAWERGERNRRTGRNKSWWRPGGYRSFARLTTHEDAIRWVARTLLPVWDAWDRATGVHRLRYEDLLEDGPGVLARQADFMGLDLDAAKIREIDAPYRAEQTRRDMKGLHFGKGRSGRHREAFSASELALCRELFGAHLERMGYPAS